jgi:uncharacterized membrane protein
MGTLTDFLFWVHLASLALGGVAVFGIPVVGSKMMAATPEQRPVLFKIMDQLSVMGRAAFALLIITGPLMLWLDFQWVPPDGLWFGIKMLFVLIILGVIIYGGINGKRAQTGDVAAAKRAPMIGMAGMVAYVLLILSAVFAFN